MTTKLETISGHPFAIRLATGRRHGDMIGPFLYYAPLSMVWALDANTLAGSADAPVTVMGTIWRADTNAAPRIDMHADKWPSEVLPNTARFEVLPRRHQLAIAYDLLLTRPLPHPVAGLPAGSQFTANGRISLPTGATSPARWKPQGETILIEHVDGRLFVQPVSGLYNTPLRPGKAP